MPIRHSIRNLLLTVDYMHPAVVGVIRRYGVRGTKQYLAEIYRCSKTDAGRFLPMIAVDDIIHNEAEFRVFRPPNWGGSMTITEISSLCQIVAARQPKKILEIGSYRGLTTLNLAMNAPQAEVHTLDLPPGADPDTTQFEHSDRQIILTRTGYFYEGRGEAARIYQHYGDTASFNYQEIGGDVDLCLIDAAHSYAYVRNDTAKTLPLLTDDALVLWHDYGRNDFLPEPGDAWGVSQFLHEIRDTGVRILQGTSFGILTLTPAVKRKLAQYLLIAH